MARLINPYVCDVCGNLKRDERGWLLVEIFGPVVSIRQWDDVLALLGRGEDRLADETFTGRVVHKHTCGIACAMRITSEILGMVPYRSASNK